LATTVYSVALITRGAGAFAYSYTGPAGLAAGALCAVQFQHRLELGLVLGPDPAPPEKTLLPLLPVQCPRWPGWGRLLLDLCELSLSAPDELTGHLLFDTPRTALKLDLAVMEPEALSTELQATLGGLAGRMKATQQKLLAKLDWQAFAPQAWSGALALRVTLAGDPAATRAPAAWKKRYKLDQATAGLLGLRTGEVAAGAYLAGFDKLDFTGLEPDRSKAATAVIGKPTATALSWHGLDWPAKWEVLRLWPRLATLPLRRCFCTWPALRQADGLAAELQAEIAAGRNVLVVAPQAWFLDRLWPQLVGIADSISRFRPDSGPSAASYILHALEAGGHAVLGGPGAWKLPAYARFDRIIVVDPTHPQYAAERTPHLDPRLALLVSASAAVGAELMLGPLSNAEPGFHPTTSANPPERAEHVLGPYSLPTIDFIELGLSALDGRSADITLHLHAPHEPPASSGQPQVQAVDTDPLPLVLRQADRRRLVYFNRLGGGRGLHCMECHAAVNCPRCGSARIHWSVAGNAYACPDCGFSVPDLRCARCGLQTLAALLPGLEAVNRRSGDVVLQGPAAQRLPAKWQTVLGTAQLLDPVPGLWPEEIIYVNAEGRLGLTADWPAAVDMALRLRSLYDNPELRSVHIVSTRLSEQFGAQLDTATLAESYRMELGLRDLGGLPPFGTLYHLRLTAARTAALDSARHELGAALHEHPGTSLLRLGREYREGGAHRLGGWLVNPQLELRTLQELRWRIHRLGATLTVNPLRGPWL
jgi:predicted RNA-binding Zn-ribbon protein involved in translation (DUF1610 family)